MRRSASFPRARMTPQPGGGDDEGAPPVMWRACRRGRRPTPGTASAARSARSPALTPCGRRSWRRSTSSPGGPGRGRPPRRWPVRPRSSTVTRARSQVHLAPSVRVEVEPGSRLADGERIRARRDRLRLERFGQPVLRHLRRNDSVQVRLERDVVHRAESSAGDGDLEVAAVGPAAEPKRRAAGKERDRARDALGLREVGRLEPEAGPNGLRPRGQVPELAEAVAGRERSHRGDAQLRSDPARGARARGSPRRDRASCRGSSARGSRRTSRPASEAVRTHCAMPTPWPQPRR